MRTAVMAIFTSFAVGCSETVPITAPPKQDGHDHSHDAPITKADVKMPVTFKELVSLIEQCDKEIEAAVGAGKPASAHRALDELDIVLDETMTLAQKAVPEDQLGVVNESRQAIRNAFLEIHQSIDAKEKPDYEANREAIKSAISKLKQSAAPSSSS